jgi:glutathionylspermidine synthase
MALQRAIDDYHALLSNDLAQESQAQLDDQLRRRGLFFGKRPLCTVLRPRFLTTGQYSFLQKSVASLLPAFDRIHDRAIADDAFRAQFRMLDWEESLLPHDPGFSDPSPVSRLDAFFTHERGGLRFTEYNAETPAAAAYNDVLAEVTLGLPIMRQFLRCYEVKSQPARHLVMHSLLESYRSWSGQRKTPRIAILDWREVPTFSEFVITAEYLRTQGLECVIADPREVEYRDGKLFAEGLHVDLIYKRVLITELIERGGLDHPVVRAVRDRAVCMVNPFRCKILHKKASLAVLSDERNADMFTAAEQAAIHAHIPWTRVVEERHTGFAGADVDLIPFLAENRERMVLKPNDDYGGTGIVLGWEVSPSDWESAITNAIAEPYIVQERITLPTEPYPALVDGNVLVSDRILDTAPFVFHGAYMDGCLTRLSSDPLVNVTAGSGSSLATFVVEPRA